MPDRHLVVRDLHVPKEWESAPMKFVAPPLFDARVKGLAVLSFMLADGTNIIVLSVPTGARWVRCGPPNGWGIEERYEGAPPADEDREVVDTIWRGILESVVDGRDEAEREHGGRPS